MVSALATPCLATGHRLQAGLNRLDGGWLNGGAQKTDQDARWPIREPSLASSTSRTVRESSSTVTGFIRNAWMPNAEACPDDNRLLNPVQIMIGRSGRMR